MSTLDHPFILKMKGVAQDKRIIYMFVEYMESGDLMKVLNKFTRLPRDHAAFYAAQIVVCFEYLHGRDLLFRDLKPENILLGNDGLIKLADFGFVKNLKAHERTFTFCGTPEYIAPEIITN
jgi:serine/threonine protein kinase